ncbi:ribosomal protein L17 [Dipodascopsis uninucleata]
MPSQGQAHRTLGRSSAHRRALLRNLVTSVIEHESITTTFARAKEAQPLVEKMITEAKENTNASRSSIYGFVFRPEVSVNKLLNVLAPRYKSRNGGYTRILHLEPRGWDAAPMAVLELVDGPRDLRFYLTAKAIARAESEGRSPDPITKLNQSKVTAKEPNGMSLLREKVELFKKLFYSGERTTEEGLLELDSAAKLAKIEDKTAKDAKRQADYEHSKPSDPVDMID